MKTYKNKADRQIVALKLKQMCKRFGQILELFNTFLVCWN